MISSALGAACLGFSFLATGSPLTVASGEEWMPQRSSYEPFTAVCYGNEMVMGTQGTGMLIDAPCPAGERYPIAEVTWESRYLFLGGWLLVIVSTIWHGSQHILRQPGGDDFWGRRCVCTINFLLSRLFRQIPNAPGRLALL